MLGLWREFYWGDTTSSEPILSIDYDITARLIGGVSPRDITQ